MITGAARGWAGTCAADGRTRADLILNDLDAEALNETAENAAPSAAP